MENVDPCYSLNLALIAVSAFLINIPFGYWRVQARKFSTEWFLAVHIPIPIIVVLRFILGVGWNWKTFPVMLMVFFLGQFLGGNCKRIISGMLN